MKKNIWISGMIASALLAGSCKKSVLDTQPYNKVGEEVIWSTKANAETFIFSTYALMQSFAGGASTDARTTNTLGFDDIYNGSQAVFTESLDRNSDLGFNNWADIRRCNMIIEKVTASSGISEDDKKGLIAEGKFLRAMSYFDVARSTGRIVWIDKVLGPNDELLLPSTANPSESYNYIIKDLEDAIPDLPEAKVPGRANKYTAAAFLTEVCLQALAYQHYPDAANVKPGDPLLDKVIKYAKVVTDGGYTLENNYGDMFNDLKPTSNEIIFGIYRKAINTSCASTPMQLMVPNMSNDQISQGGGSPLLSSPIRIFEAWVQHGPTQNISDDYLVIDQANPSQALRWDKTSQYLAAVDENASIPVNKIPVAAGETSVKHGVIKPSSTQTVWSLTNAGRDARWNASILSDSSSKFYGEILTTTINGNASRWLKISGKAYYQSLSNMYWRKGIYNNVTPRIYADVNTDYHYVVTRLGRVLLNLAEAYLLKGDVSNAVVTFNKTRTIHGKLPASTAISLNEAWIDYKRERRVDLVLENDYYWSLLRWGRFGGPADSGISSGGVIPELTELPRVIDISKDRKYFSVVQGSFFSSNNVRAFNTRRYLGPISQSSYLDRNPKFGPQNPGW
jgi:hypothetical protein